MSFRFQVHVPSSILSQITDLSKAADSFHAPELQDIITLWSHLGRVVTANSTNVDSDDSLISVHTESDEYHCLLGKLVVALDRL
jgi:hypothetical protein